MTRRQLEYEARQIRVAMEEQLGTCQDMEKRAQVNYLLLNYKTAQAREELLRM